MEKNRKNILFFLKYIVISVFYIIKKPKVQIMDDEKTLEYINNGCSISRFGDGEIRWLLNSKSTPGFQSRNLKLSNDLKSVFSTVNEKLLICLPENIINMKNKTIESKYFWKKFVFDYWKDIKPYINDNYVYGNTNLTRFYMDYTDKTICNKKIWKNKKLLIVEGCKTRLGVGNDLFDSCKSIRRILCPATNAYDKVDEIYKSIIKYIDKTDLILLALGPTATVLACQLNDYGIQSLDIGHIDIEYEWFRRKAVKKVPIDGKYVNELGGIAGSDNILNDKYINEIVKEIK